MNDKMQSGLDALKEKMKEIGCKTAQIESKTAAIVLDILTNNETLAVQQWEFEEEQKEAENKAEKRQKYLNEQENHVKEQERKLEKLKKQIIEQFEEAEKYIDCFNEALKNCETEEQRDKLRLAQMFINTVDVNTVYDNTAFIIGLASILSGTQTDPLEEMKKLNTKLFCESKDYSIIEHKGEKVLARKL